MKEIRKMNNEDRDKMLIEINTDVKWIKEQHTRHLAEHAKYTYMMIAAMFTAFVGLFR